MRTTTTNTSSKLTKKEQEILTLLYAYRFINRKQIQQLLGHKDYKTVNQWLKKLREGGFVEWIYSTDFLGKTKPAIYYLCLNGIRCLRQLDIYPEEELRKRYREADRSEGFRTRSMILVECCIGFTAKSSQAVRYEALTHAQYTNPKSEYHFLSELAPQLVVIKRQGHDCATYFLEVFDEAQPRNSVRRRLRQYAEFLTDGSWEAERNDELPVLLLVCNKVSDLIYLKRRLRSNYADELEDEELDVRLTTVEKLQGQGATAEIWEQV